MLIKTYLLASLFSFLSAFSFSQSLDVSILNSINQNVSTSKNNYFKLMSQSVTVLNLAAPLSVFTAGCIRHDKQMKRDAAYMMGGFVFSSVLTQGLKRIIKRDRPYVTHPNVLKSDAGGGYSFPSGHTSAAFCTVTSLSLLYPKWYVVAPAYLYACSVGYARVYEGVHYPSDVLAGAIVGAGSALLAYKIEKWRAKKSKTLTVQAVPSL